MKIPHSKPTLSTKEMKAVSAVIKSAYVAPGAQVRQFEQHFAKRHKTQDAVAVNSGTSALHMALAALNIKAKDEVIIPSYACSALLNAVLYTGAKPIIADVDETDFNLSVESVRKHLSRKTKAVIAVHSFGLAADLSALKRLGVTIIEDCAQSVGAKYGPRLVGTIGEIGVFSFYATKMITTAEGGMVISRSRSLIKNIRDIIDYDNRSQFKLRYNYKMSDMQAAMGSVQLKQLSRFIARRRELAERYCEHLDPLKCVLPIDLNQRRHIFYRYVIRLSGKHTAANIINRLNQAGIEARAPVFKPLHQLYKSHPCPAADALVKSAVSLPIYPTLSNTQVDFICKKLSALLSK